MGSTTSFISVAVTSQPINTGTARAVAFQAWAEITGVARMA
jgi:hypothetical protein